MRGVIPVCRDMVWLPEGGGFLLEFPQGRNEVPICTNEAGFHKAGMSEPWNLGPDGKWFKINRLEVTRQELLIILLVREDINFKLEEQVVML